MNVYILYPQNVNCSTYPAAQVTMPPAADIPALTIQRLGHKIMHSPYIQHFFKKKSTTVP